MPQIDVVLSQSELKDVSLKGKVVAAIDTLRATSTIIVALSNGARRIYPVSTIEEALALKEKHPDMLVAGERGGAKVPGFDLGNSPRECSISVVQGKELILTTSNGTPLLASCREAETVYIAALLNRHRVAEKCLAPGRDIVIACAGSNKSRVALEDVAAAGAIVEHCLKGGASDVTLTDGAKIALQAFLAWHPRLLTVLTESPAGHNLQSLGYAEDITLCSQLDIIDRVPTYYEGAIF